MTEPENEAQASQEQTSNTPPPNTGDQFDQFDDLDQGIDNEIIEHEPITHTINAIATIDDSKKNLPHKVDENRGLSSVKQVKLPDLSDFPYRYQLFVEELPIDWNKHQAAMRAGYAKSSADEMANRICQIPEIRAHIQAAWEGRKAIPRMSKERLESEIEMMCSADHNEISQYRRVCCRYCWGEGHKYQFTVNELARHKREWDKGLFRAKSQSAQREEDYKKLNPYSEEGGVGYTKHRPPNKECPECFGEGEGEPFIADTRYISQRARSIFAGVEVTREGIKVKTHAKPLDIAARKEKLYGDNAPVQNNMIILSDRLEEIYKKGMEKSITRDNSVSGRAKRMEEYAKNNNK